LLIIIIRTHRSTTYVDTAYCHRPSSVVCGSVCHSREPCKNGWTDRDAVWVVYWPQPSVCVSVCPSPHFHTIARTRTDRWGTRMRSKRSYPAKSKRNPCLRKKLLPRTVHTSSNGQWRNDVRVAMAMPAASACRALQRRAAQCYHFPYLPIVTNPENNPCIQTVIRLASKI